MTRVSYYRLKRIDFDGKPGYSRLRSVDKGAEQTQVLMYPNTTLDQLVIEGNQAELDDVTIYNQLGDDVTKLVEITKETGSKATIYVVNLLPGMYFVITKNGSLLIQVLKTYSVCVFAGISLFNYCLPIGQNYLLNSIRVS